MRVSRTCPAVHASDPYLLRACAKCRSRDADTTGLRSGSPGDASGPDSRLGSHRFSTGRTSPANPSRHHARGRFELGHHLLSPVNVQPVTGEGKWDGPWVFPSPGSSWRTSSSARFRPDFAPGVVVLLKVRKVLIGAKKTRGPAFAGPLRDLIAPTISANQK